MQNKVIDTGSDFSGVGAFDQALEIAGITQNKVFACDMDKHARQTYIHNYGAPAYYPENVYNREIPINPLGTYMTSPPCQAFSYNGKRKGELDDRGVLFYNSHGFIKSNNPKTFIFENVKGLLTHDEGKTFQKWITLLGGKSINGLPTVNPHPDAVNYRIYWKVLNAKDFGVPQNRERVFIVGIRADINSGFSFPRPCELKINLQDLIEKKVNKKYFLDTKRAKELIFKPLKNRAPELPFHETKTESKNKDFVLIRSATKRGFEIAKTGDSINFTHPKSMTRRGRVGKGVAQTLDTQCNQGIIDSSKLRNFTPRECFRIMSFPDSFTWPVSDRQAFKQAGNSIPPKMLAEILKKLPLNQIKNNS